MRLAACDPQMGANEAHAERVRLPRKRYCGASGLVASALDHPARAQDATLPRHSAPRLEVVHGPHVRLCHAEIVTDEKEVGKQSGATSLMQRSFFSAKKLRYLWSSTW